MNWNEIAEKLSAPIVKALLGKAAVPDDSPYTTGGIGLLGTLPSQEAMEDCDTLLIVGSSFPYIEFLPKPGQARAVQIDLDPLRIGLRYPVEVGLVGDCQRSLRKAASAAAIEQGIKGGFLKRAQAGMKDWNKRMDQQAAVAHHADEAAAAGRGTWASACPPTPSSIATQGPSPPGGRATFARSAGRCIRSPGISPLWRAACRTPLLRRSLIRIGCALALSATADSAC